LLRLVLPEQPGLPELAPQVQQGPQPLALLVLLETELMRLEQLGLQVPPERPEPVLQVQQVLVQPEQPSAQPLLA
jgi:hypothetical protein